MEESFIPDYSKYDPEFLIDVYTRIDRENNPLKAKALDEEIKKRFNLDPEKEIDPTVVLAFINTYKRKSERKEKTADKNLSMINQGWIAGIVLGGLTLIVWTIGMLRQDSNINGSAVNVYGIVDILGIFALSYGIYNKSRVCAIFLASYYLLVQLYLIFTLPAQMVSIRFPGLIIFTIFFVRASIGTIRYHQVLNTLPAIDYDTIICPNCGEKNHVSEYKCACGHILKA